MREKIFEIQYWKKKEAAPVRGNERVVVNVIIGEKQDGIPIVEQIYDDIFDGLVSGAYQFAAYPGADPKILVYCEGILIDHNAAIESDRKQIIDKLGYLDPSLVEEGRQDIFNSYSETKAIGIKGNLLKYQLLNAMNKTMEYPTELIYAVLVEEDKMKQEQLYAPNDENVYTILKEGVDKYIAPYLAAERKITDKNDFYAAFPEFENVGWSVIRSELQLVMINNYLGL